ncbi:MAG: GNAT family N-acetyltransferase, partial [Clostridia bacterium]|nr:GNAT family N-acetyltransferase [Clostridia bacterium]
WSNALCEKRKELDVLGVGAYDNGRLIGLAACSADCDNMWQIGIDVSADYRRQGIAAALTSQLALEILKRGKVPFYCTAWSNIKSVRNAIKSGFRPAWVELTAKPANFVEEINKV